MATLADSGSRLGQWIVSIPINAMHDLSFRVREYLSPIRLRHEYLHDPRN